jgi:hypothetical protein
MALERGSRQSLIPCKAKRRACSLEDSILESMDDSLVLGRKTFDMLPPFMDDGPSPAGSLVKFLPY